MATQVDDFTVQIADRISVVDAAEWDACAGDDPFTCHAHLLALEQSGSVSPQTGFQPSHVILRDPSGRVAAAAPAYIKHHSEAEVGADMGWSLAHERFCGPYYPKLQVEVPFCPFTGPRLLVRDDLEKAALREQLLKELIASAKQRELSSIHISFMTLAEQDLATRLGMLPSIGTDFLWENNNYSKFDDFLMKLKSDRRHMIRYERKKLNDAGLHFKHATGSKIDKSIENDMYNCYLNTCNKYNINSYLEKSYFSNIFEKMKNNILCVLCYENNIIISGSISFLDKNCIYVRYWGSKKEINFAHFETTYYQTIKYAIEHGIPHLAAGADGDHKVPRGMLPVNVYHTHWFRNEAFADVIATGLKAKLEGIQNQRKSLMQRNPFRPEK